MVSQQLKKYLQTNGIKQSWLALKLGMTESKVSQILNGKSPLHADIFIEICLLLEIDCNCFKPPSTPTEQTE